MSSMQIAIFSDTHIPDQADAIPGVFREHIPAADHAIHAGDFGSIQTLDRVRDMAEELTAVHGNADPIDIDLPAVASLTVDDVTFVVLHGVVNPVERATDSSNGVVFDRDDWLDAIADTTRYRGSADTIVGVGGHTHHVEDALHDGIRVLNPGSATGTGPAEGQETMMTAELTDNGLDVVVHEP